MRLRAWVAFGAAGSALALAYRGDWLAAAVVGACVVLPAVWWLRGEFAATREMLRESGRPEPYVPRPREADHPPWLTAPMPAIHDASCPSMASMMPDRGGCRCGVRR